MWPTMRGLGTVALKTGSFQLPWSDCLADLPLAGCTHLHKKPRDDEEGAMDRNVIGPQQPVEAPSRLLPLGSGCGRLSGRRTRNHFASASGTPGGCETPASSGFLLHRQVEGDRVLQPSAGPSQCHGIVLHWLRGGTTARAASCHANQQQRSQHHQHQHWRL